MQGTQDDLGNHEQIQQEALGSVGLKNGAPPVSADWACPQCQKCFANKQAMRMHEVAVHKAMHIAHVDLPATICQCCMWEYHTKEKAIRHLKTTKTCLPRMRYYCPEGLGYGKETAEGMELARLKSEPRTRLIGLPRWTEEPPPGAALFPPPLGYVTPEELTARIQQRNQDPDDQGWGSVEDFKNQAAASNLGDITLFLGPIEALVVF